MKTKYYDTQDLRVPNRRRQRIDYRGAKICIADLFCMAGLLVVIAAISLPTVFAAQLRGEDEGIASEISEKTFAGIWEGLDSNARELLHMEMIVSGKGYLFVQSIASSEYSLFALQSAEIDKGGLVKLHFHNVSPQNDIQDYWFEGKGQAAGTEGRMEGKLWNEIPPRPKDNVTLIKGVWTRNICKASQLAESVVRSRLREDGVE